MHLLVVEDESRMAALLQKGLTQEGNTVTVAGDATLASARAQAAI